jgi:membrane protease subunit (stomatin/prohibitin family)
MGHIINHAPQKSIPLDAAGRRAAERIEIIESITPDPNLLMWKFADEDKEIQNGAKLTVRESQRVMLLCEGRAADVFGPGLHTLSTAMGVDPLGFDLQNR